METDFSLDYSWPQDRDMASLPFADLEENADDYYDTTKFCFPIMLTSPKVIPRHELFDFATYLTIISNPGHPTPFTFRAKSDILIRVKRREKAVEVQHHRSKEIIEELDPKETSKETGKSAATDSGGNSGPTAKTAVECSEGETPPSTS